MYFWNSELAYSVFNRIVKFIRDIIELFYLKFERKRLYLVQNIRIATFQIHLLHTP